MNPSDEVVDDFRKSQLASVGDHYWGWADITEHQKDRWRFKYKAAVRLIAAQTLRDFDEFARNEHDRTGTSGTVFNGGFGYALRLVGERADELDPS